MRNKFLLGVVLLFVINLEGYSQMGAVSFKDPSFINAVLKEHNVYRSALQLPALTWSAALAADAQAWASRLAANNKGQHDQSVRGKEGENIWWGTAGAYSWTNMVDFWVAEKKDFVYGVFPDCSASKSAVVGHYTQLIWKTTTSVGCAVVSNGKMDYMVCRYSPPGNMIGQKPY